MDLRSNQSLGDQRQFKSNFYLPLELVEQYANEVKSRQNQPKPQVPAQRQDSDSSDDEAGGAPAFPDDGQGDPTDGAGPEITPCAKNWKAAAAEDKKKMWNMFMETGIFGCACKHMMIVWIVDMVRSGEK